MLFESPHRLGETLTDILETLGDRPVAVARELTKVHEEVLRGPVSKVLERLGGEGVRGEIVVVVEGARRQAAGDVGKAVNEATSLIAAGMRKRAAAAEVARRHGVSVNELYRALLAAP